MTDKPDAYDVTALERSLNESAGRFSSIWVSFLIFGLYILIGITTLQPRQIFLAEPIKLPVLNIELPLLGFFTITPVLYLVFHIYVLLQLILLRNTACAYNVAVDRQGLAPILRQRLTNTLFAQIFAGSPREREGGIGLLLRGMAWTTLVAMPVFILVVFQFSFLAYHSHFVTWIHRILILMELLYLYFACPSILIVNKYFNQAEIKSKDFSMSRSAGAIFILLVYFSVSWLFASFPGEPHINILRGKPYTTVQCTSYIPYEFDRITLANTTFIDEEQLNKFVDFTERGGKLASGGPRTQDFEHRDFSCGRFVLDDLRRADFTNAQLSGVDFSGTDLRGTSLVNANLKGAIFDSTTDLSGANLQSAHLEGAYLQGTKLQGAILEMAQLQGAELTGAFLQGADLQNAHLEGADLAGAQLQMTYLANAVIEASDANNAQFTDAYFYKTQLQGTNLNGAHLDLARLEGVSTWGVDSADCSTAYVRNSSTDDIIKQDNYDIKVSVKSKNYFYNQVINKIQGVITSNSKDQLENVKARVVNYMINNSPQYTTDWHSCEKQFDSYDKYFSKSLIYLICDMPTNQNETTEEIFANQYSMLPDNCSKLIAESLLNDRLCSATTEFTEGLRGRLRRISEKK